jgi:hypothetical protein
MKLNSVQQMADAREAAFGILERDAPHESMYFIAEREQMFRQVAAVLSGYARDQSLQIMILPFSKLTSWKLRRNPGASQALKSG